MGNVFNIASKEFNDLINNRYILVVLALYFFMIAYMVYNVYSELPELMLNGDLLAHTLQYYNNILVMYGVLIAMVIGFVAVSLEWKTSALNTLIVKPVYRDTIINGKFVGALGYLLSLFLIATIVYIFALVLFCGAPFVSIILDFISRAFPLFAASLLYVLVFFFLSMLLSIITKGQSYSLILCIFLWNVVRGGSTLGFIATVLYSTGLMNYMDACNLLFSATPDTIRSNLSSAILDPSTGIVSIFSPIELGKLVLYVIVMVVLSYIAFLRSDVR
ncbi:ABC transporter permease [Methanocella conradii]|uniref:ABC transporter permease n=1 Tax=Methanocella conradii TaxID=1175444 RepID=UPI0024B3C4DF|nr:ABC transporter permease subunit [Methanocella conradii]MDI6898020.1 ABC transporter permease subunit [Methanocella conradii]